MTWETSGNPRPGGILYSQWSVGTWNLENIKSTSFFNLLSQWRWNGAFFGSKFSPSLLGSHQLSFWCLLLAKKNIFGYLWDVRRRCAILPVLPKVVKLSDLWSLIFTTDSCWLRHQSQWLASNFGSLKGWAIHSRSKYPLYHGLSESPTR